MQNYSASTPATPQSFQFNLQKQNPKHFRITAVTQKIIRMSQLQQVGSKMRATTPFLCI